MHGGTIIAESPGRGHGATFTVRLPLARAPQPMPEPKAVEVAARAAPRLKVLVVDDNQDIAQMLGWMLEEIGHEYLLAHDGQTALGLAKTFLPNVVLLDIGLQGMDGYAVCKAFRREALFKTLPIIAHSGWGQSRDKTLATDAGFNHYLVKPVSLGDLEKTLESVANGSLN